MNIDELGRTPVPGPLPAGEDVRYDPDYGLVLAEIDKLNSVTGLEPDWNRVVEKASSILEGKAKDLLVAVYLSVGLTQIQGLEGLATGSRILADMVELFWEECFPAKKRLRGRANAFSWWQEKTLAWARGLPGGMTVPDDLRRTAREHVARLDASLGKLSPDLPSLGELVRMLEGLPVKPEPQPDAAAPQSGGFEGTGDEALPPIPPDDEAAAQAGSPAAPADAKAARRALVEAALSFAALTRSETPEDPWPWKATRLAAWIPIKKLPPSQGGQTMIPPPDPAIKPGLLTQLKDGKLLEAALMAEEHFTGAIFWLDLQRIVARALEGLGEDFAAALDAVRLEVIFLLKRLRGLEQFSFSDGTPFADSESRSWMASLTSGRSGERSRAGEGENRVNNLLEEAMARHEKEDESGALDLINRAMREAGDGPSRMRLRLGQVDLLCRTGRFAVASSLADELVDEIDARHLETWDPDLALSVFLAGRDACMGLGGQEGASRARAFAARIARIRPSAALNLPES